MCFLFFVFFYIIALCHVLSGFDYMFFNRGFKHDFSFINICKVPREVLKIEGEARGFFNLPEGRCEC